MPGIENCQVSKYLERLCGCDNNGGRITINSSGKIVVSDIPSWSHSMTHCIENRFPGVDVSVYQNSSSLSGFVVVIQKPAPVSLFSTLVSITCTVLLGLSAGYTVFLLAPQAGWVQSSPSYSTRV
jgi:hypothetical protein